MNKPNLPLSEENIFNNIDYLQNQLYDTVEIYKKLTTMLPIDDYKSIDSNYIALYIYDLIKKQTPIKEFENFIIHLYNDKKLDEHSLNQTFGRFFEFNSTNITFTHFSKFDKYNNEFSIWDKLQYVFYISKNEQPGLDPSTLPYLKAIVTHVNKNVVTEFGNKIASLYFTLANNFADFIPILDLINKNKAFKYSDKDTKNFVGIILYYMSSNSYDLKESVKAKIFHILSLNLDDFDKQFNNNLCQYDNDLDRFQLSYGLLNYYKVVGMDNIIHIINNSYQNEINNIRINNPEELSFFDQLLIDHNLPILDKYYNIAQAIKIPLDIGFKDYCFEVPLDNIDFNKNLYENFVYIKLLTISLINGHTNKIPKVLRSYITEQLDQSENQYNLPLIDFNIKQYLSYLALDEKIPLKTDNIRKNKI